MSSNHSRRSRRSRVGPSDDDSPPENRQRPVQKAVQYIPEEHLPAWGERWTAAPPRRKSDNTSRDTRAPVFKFEHGLSEFKLQLDSPPTQLTPDDHDPSNLPVVYSHSGRPTKRKNRRTRKRAPPLASESFLQPSSTRASTEEPSPDTPASAGSFSTSLQAESVVATSSALSGGSITPETVFYDYPVPQAYDNRNLSIPMYNHYQHGVLASSLTQHGSQSLPYGAVARGSQSQVSPFPDTTVEWAPEHESRFIPSIAPSCYHHGPDANHREVDAIDGGTFLNYPSSDPRLPRWNM
ncbi:hypothetical protein M378DRAFT_7272 [Amanita muscaria Koide BX008]|uniref:Uncharacterized protein n=1 Tax=Amanita muscaria (strain Koide BX008) TaxID=946122 RepID=A0A0C2X7U2_AMAMK|nr:hypothetical protein M378DRAFT_7272 [Amanita muscaria Koide BX008]